jgi:hypothetical protein
MTAITITATTGGHAYPDPLDAQQQGRLHVRVAVNGEPAGAAYFAAGMSEPPVEVEPGDRLQFDVERVGDNLYYQVVGQVLAQVDADGHVAASETFDDITVAVSG